eukprot:SAG25_NODE_7845_length_454_cov_1.197183_2_plen_49_part_01
MQSCNCAIICFGFRFICSCSQLAPLCQSTARIEFHIFTNTIGCRTVRIG